MKKIYLYLVLALSCLMSVRAMAREVVTEVGKTVTHLTDIKVGDRLMFFCNGPLNPDDKEYGLRQAFLCERDDFKLFISRDLQESTLESGDFLWTVLSYEKAEGDETSYKISLKSPRGNLLPIFTENTEGKPRWPGVSVSPEEGEAAVFTVSMTDIADSLFYIYDENGVFFNGQSIGTDKPKGQARFVGWNSPGANSLYRIYRPTVAEKATYDITMVLNDENGEKEENSNVVVTALMGDTLQAPEWEHHTFVSAVDGETDVPVTFPYVVEDKESFLLLMYETWPLISISCVDEATGEVIYASEAYLKKGSKLSLPGKEHIGIGYSLVTEGYEDYEITKSETIVLKYRRDGKNLPFEATTLTDGKFADNTKWYLMKVGNGKVLGYDEPSDGVTCGSVTDYGDVNLWTFVGDTEKGYRIYNKQAGSSMILWAPDGENKTQVFMTPSEETTEPNTFDLNFNEDGFSWKLHGTEMSYLNDLGEAGILKFWTNAKSATGDGSRFTFAEYTEDLAHALRYGDYISYLQAEDCVGGWTGSALAELKAAYEKRDTAACRMAVENLAEADTIAFDANKTYVLVSAFKDFIADQPQSSYAMAVEADSALSWKALEAADPSFHFGFSAASDTTYYMVSAQLNLPVGGFRFGDFARCVEWGDLSLEENALAVGHPAGFSVVKNATAPASYYFVHNYGASIITLSADPNQNSKATEGKISTYNTKNGKFNNYWRLKPVGEWSAIETVVTAPGRQQPVIYDLSGRRVNKAVKGLYIVDGKKVYVK